MISLRQRLPCSLKCIAGRGVRNVQTQAVLQTPTDWAEFQQARAETKSLIELFEEYGSVRTEDAKWRPRDAVEKPIPNATISALLASGAHFGHATSRMNPSFMPYAYGTRGGITIIDLDHTIPLLRRASNFLRQVGYGQGAILFVGTRADLRNVVAKAAERVGERGYYVNDRWLPGTLTNRQQLFGSSTIKSLKVTPDAVVVLNPLQNIPVIQECALEHVPTIGIVDTNVDPRIVMYPIPANDESPRTAEIIAGVLSIAAREGMAMREAEDARKRREQQRYEELMGPAQGA
ncbi:mitochondrial ribosomal protein subunit S2 [Fistulina hepatica ATCC 64428]|nr:mitochondrial ribosomal protein subunit S2 [Fistulina hepatica ATCC 64428]